MPNGEDQQARDFLEEQLKNAYHKIARLEHVRRTCDDCVEATGLDAMLRSAKAERRVIEDLLARRPDETTVPSLGAQIMARLDQLRSHPNGAAIRWRRGKPTPPAYWDITHSRTILEQLLRRWHAWRAGRPYYPSVTNGAGPATSHHAPPARANLRGNPWSGPIQTIPGAGSSAMPEDREKLLEHSAALVERVLAVLERAGIARDHVDIVFASDHEATVTAFVHSEAERRVIVNTLIASDEIEMVLADIRVVDPNRCPSCRRRSQNGTPSSPPPGG